MSVGRRFTGPKPQVLGLSPMIDGSELQNWIDKISDSEADGQPPDHGAAHAFTGSDPLTAPTTTPTTVEGGAAASIGTGSNPAREDHRHALNTTGVPGAVTGASATQGGGPGVSLSGHTHAVPAEASTALVLAFLAL